MFLKYTSHAERNPVPSGGTCIAWDDDDDDGDKNNVNNLTNLVLSSSVF